MTPWTSSGVFAALEPFIPQNLVGDHQLDACRRIAARLPRQMTSYYLECRLHDDPQVDFLALTTKRGTAGHSFADQWEKADDVSSRNLRALRAWAAGSEELDLVPAVWFEYDVDDRFDREAPVASPSFGVERCYQGRFSGNACVDVEEAHRLARSCLAQVLTPAEFRGMEGMLRRSVDALSGDGALIYASATLARAENVVKLYLSMPRSDVLGYLDSVGWPGDRSAVDSLLETYYPGVSTTVFLDLSITGAPLRRLGFALSQLHLGELSTFSPDWSAVPIPGAVTRKREGLAGWSGTAEARIDGVRTCLRRWLDMKIVLTTEDVLQFKAYLGFMPSFPLPFT
jgi:hypothetical protein